MAEDGAHFLKPDVIRGTSDKEPVLVPFSYSSNKEMEAVDTVSKGHDYGWGGGVGGTLVPHGMD